MEITTQNKIYALKPDVDARGIDRVIDAVTLVGYARFVDLVAEQKTHSWI